MDGIDGIAGAEAITTSLSVLFLLWIHGSKSPYIPWLGVLSVSIGGFLIWNWPPAKIFMGDACSGFLGYLMGVFALLTSSDKIVNVWTWGILLGIFIVDATLTLVQRVINREDVTQPHRSHAYQILARRFGSHQKVTMAVCAVNICWLLPFAFLSVFLESYSILFLILSYMPILLFFWCTRAGKKTI
jgi:Fuc2NAc and GlcNAc transferase